MYFHPNYHLSPRFLTPVLSHQISAMSKGQSQLGSLQHDMGMCCWHLETNSQSKDS